MVLSLWGAKNQWSVALNHLLQYFMHLISCIVIINLKTLTRSWGPSLQASTSDMSHPLMTVKGKMVFTMNWMGNNFIPMKNNSWAFFHWQILLVDMLHPYPWSRMHCFLCKHGLCMDLYINFQILHSFPSLNSLNPILVLCLLSGNHKSWFFYHRSS